MTVRVPGLSRWLGWLGRAGCSLADALGQRGLAAEARALLCAILPSSLRLLETDTLHVGRVLGPLQGGQVVICPASRRESPQNKLSPTQPHASCFCACFCSAEDGPRVCTGWPSPLLSHTHSPSLRIATWPITVSSCLPTNPSMLSCPAPFH